MAGSIEIDDRGVIVACAACGKKNRLAFERLGDSVRCGECKAPIEGAGEPIEMHSSADFDRLVAKSSLPVVVDYWAPWCGPCRMVAPELQKVAARQAGQVLVVKVNTDELSDLGQRFGIRSIPTLAIFAGGKEIGARRAARGRRPRSRRSSREREPQSRRGKRSPGADALKRRGDMPYHLRMPASLVRRLCLGAAAIARAGRSRPPARSRPPRRRSISKRRPSPTCSSGCSPVRTRRDRWSTNTSRASRRSIAPVRRCTA